jgi:hypothetical protein
MLKEFFIKFKNLFVNNFLDSYEIWVVGVAGCLVGVGWGGVGWVGVFSGNCFLGIYDKIRSCFPE